MMDELEKDVEAMVAQVVGELVAAEAQTFLSIEELGKLATNLVVNTFDEQMRAKVRVRVETLVEFRLLCVVQR